MNVPERFKRRILTHAFAAHCYDHYPLLLAILGPPGDGKSAQTEAVLTGSGFTPFRFSAAELGGSTEGRPIEQLESILKRADTHANLQGSNPVIVLEDFDLSPAGRDKDARYTVNSQLLTGFLMNLADGVSLVNGVSGRRIPIMLTANNITNLHGPLTRPGRMDVFVWEPTSDERIAMVYSALHEHVRGMSLARAAYWCNRYPQLSIAAFRGAVLACVGELIYDRVARARTAVPLDAVREQLAVHRPQVSLTDLDRTLTQRYAAPLPRQNFLVQAVRGQ